MIQDPTKALFVPVHLDAICVSEEDAKKRPLAPASYNFAALRDIPENPRKLGDDAKTKNPYLTDGNIPHTFGNDTEVRAGVHLHWQFDAAMTHGRTVYRLEADDILRLHLQVLPALINKEKSDAIGFDVQPSPLKPLLDKTYDTIKKFREDLGLAVKDPDLPLYRHLIEQEAITIDFPPLPTRWLIFRCSEAEGQNRAWLIESDYLGTEDVYQTYKGESGKPKYYPSTIIPSPGESQQASEADKHYVRCNPQQDRDDGKPYVRYLGRVRALDEDWAPGVQDEQGEHLSPRPLTAVGYGNPTFAAYAQDCTNVFSFLDTVQDVSGPATFSYLVVGWYDDAEQDPLAGKDVVELKAMLLKNKWTLGSEAADWDALLNRVSGSIFTGFLRDVQWSNANNYFPASASTTTPKLVLANTAPEALAAYLAEKTSDPKKEEGGLLPEEWLNALQLGFLPQVMQADDPEMQYEELAHTHGFRPQPGGYRWQLHPRSTDEAAEARKTTLPKALYEQLNPLNKLQREYDDLLGEYQGNQQDLYAHWYWYNKWSYDPAFWGDEDAEAEEEVSRRDRIDGLDQKTFDELLQFQPDSSWDDKIVNSYETQSLGYQSYLLRKKMKEIKQQLSTLHQSLENQSLQNDYQLELARAARYWEPNDPVLMLIDEDSPTKQRVNRTGTESLRCRIFTQLLPGEEQWWTALSGMMEEQRNQDLKVLATVLPGLLAEAQYLIQADWESLKNDAHQAGTGHEISASFGLTGWGDGTTTNPWYPIILQYSVGFTVLNEGRKEKYPTNFLTESLALDHNHVELRYKKNEDGLGSKDIDTKYLGTVVLTQGATQNLQHHLRQLDELPTSPTLEEVLGKANEALKQAQLGNSTVLTQSLSDFNQRIIARSGAVQLPIFDPYEDNDDKQQQVSAGVGNQRRYSPVTTDLFNPIRCGLLRVERIRLVDVFGQVRDYRDFNSPIRPLAFDPKNQMVDNESEADFPLRPKDGNLSNVFALPPRLAQAARLNFRWLPVAEGNPSPIGGWVLSNHLDNSLMVYDEHGQYLGDLQSYRTDGSKVNWVPAFRLAGKPEVPAPAQWKESIIKDFVQGWLAETAKKFNDFRDTVENVLCTIDPQHRQQEDAPTVLMGRPLAMVRAGLRFELRGAPVSNWTQEAFGKYLDDYKAYQGQEAGPSLPNDQFDEVKLPVRLGDLGDLADGFIGYFPYQDGHGQISKAAFQAEDNADLLFLTAADEQATELLLLVDPRFKVHATTGILPTKAIDIPEEYYQAALARMEFDFLCAPVLSPAQRVAMPFPQQKDAHWEWVTATATEAQTPQPPLLNAQFGERALELHEGWLRRRLIDSEETKPQ